MAGGGPILCLFACAAIRYACAMELKVSDLSCARGGMPVLEGVDFTLSGGEMLLLRGPNGIGKTTLLRTLAGLQPALGGTIIMPPESLAYGAHADGLKAMLTVRENLAFWARVHGVPDMEREVVRALDEFNLNDLADRPARSLSAGQKRRLGLARLLLTGRPIWALDEPTVSLDTESVALFAETVRRHCAAGGMAIMATHIGLGLEARALDLSAFRADPDSCRAGGGSVPADAFFGDEDLA